MGRFALSLLLLMGPVTCGEGVREFSPPPTLTPTSPAAVATTARPVTAPPSTPVPTNTPTAAPSSSASRSPSPTPAATTAPSPSPSPVRTASPSPAPTGAAQPTPPPGASLPAMPAQPALSGTLLASGTVTFSISPGEARKFEAANLAASRGATPPANATLAWTIAWRAVEPLTSAWYRQDSRIELGRGRWGTADLGGAAFELRNDTGAPVFGELSFLIGSR